MPDDHAIATGAPRTIILNGQTYRVQKFGPRLLGELEAWLKTQVPDPRLMARELCAGLSDAVAIEIWRDLSAEAKDWPVTVDSREGNRLLTMTHEGATQVIYAMLRKFNPDMDLARAATLAADIEAVQVNELISLGWPEPTFDPKSPPGPTTEDRGPV